MPPKHRVTWLQTIRILSRDRCCLDSFVSRQSLHALACYADITMSEEPIPQPPDMDAVLESLKCLCNLVLSSPTAQMLAAEARLVVRLAERVGLYRKRSYPHEVQFFDLRLLFLLTALRTDVRQQLFQELHGVRLLTDALELTLGVAPKENPPVTLPAQETERAMEILKVLFNITFDSVKREVDEVSCSLKPWVGLSSAGTLWFLLPFIPQILGCPIWQGQEESLGRELKISELCCAAGWWGRGIFSTILQVAKITRCAVDSLVTSSMWPWNTGTGTPSYRSPLLSLVRKMLSFTGTWGPFCGTV